MSDEKIKKHNLIGLLEFVQKHVRDRKFIKQATETLAYILNKLDQDISQNGLIEVGSCFKNYVHSNLFYIYYFGNNINDQKFVEKLETVDFVKREKIMGALARKIKEKGKDEKTKEIVKCMLNAGSDIQFITKVTGLSDKEINELK